MKLFFLYLLSLVYTSCTTASNYENSEHTESKMNNQKLNFDSTILLINEKVVDLTTTSYLFEFEEFRIIYEDPRLYQSDAIAFLLNEKNPLQAKLIATLAMQRSELEDYIVFFREVATLFIKDNCNELILSAAISSSINKRYLIIKNYKNPQIVDILNELKKCNKTSSELKERIDNILSGYSWKSVSVFL